MTASVQEPQIKMANVVFGLATSAGVGALAGHIFSLISPVGGAIFGVTSSIASQISGEILNCVGCDDTSNTAFEISKFAIPLIIGSAVGALALSLSGFPITFTAALVLSGAVWATSFLISLAITCACGTCLVAGIGAAAAAGATGNRPVSV